MRYVGVDLHKQSLSLCVVELAVRERKIIERRKFRCDQEEQLAEYFAQLGAYQVVLEATDSYVWFVQVVEPTADRVVLAHPSHLRVIAQSKRKTDKLDAQTLAEFLALDQIPEAWRPTPRVRQHRELVRYRQYVVGRSTSVKNKLRRMLSQYNADLKNLFTKQGRQYLATIALSETDRFVVDLLCEELDQHCERLARVERQLRMFAKQAPIAEQEARTVLESMPCVGPVTIEVVLAEAGDIRRFGSQRKATAYAGLAPGIRESAGKAKQLGITKQGSRLLRTTLVETAWRLVNKTRRWASIYEKLRVRCGAKKAIVAVARRVWCVMVSMLQSGQKYQPM